MKRILMLSAMMLVVNLAFSQQKVNRDPSYSVHNYKHPNKAAYAREHNLDQSKELDGALVTANENYKQPFNKSKSRKAVLSTRSVDKSAVSYKHPLGL